MPSKEEIVFYRKYRPKSFSEIVNQEIIKKILQNALRFGKISHAYLFAGPRGTGKTTLARIFAKRLNCKDPQDSEPCNYCDICKDIDEGRFPDIIEIDAASNRGIDDIRELREGIKFSPIRGRYKVFIIDEAHMLTKEAFNALLKILEEPPSHVVFILATTEPERLPTTIVSRTQRFDFKRVTVHDIEKKLLHIAQQENIKIEKAALHLISSVSEGSFRDAESIFSQITALHDKEDTITLEMVEMIIGTMRFEKLKEFIIFLTKDDIHSAIKFLQDSVNNGYDAHELSRLILNILRKILLIKLYPKIIDTLSHEHTKEEIEDMLELSRQFELKKLAKLTKNILQAHPMIKRSIIPLLPLELAIIDVYSSQEGTTIGGTG